MHLIIRIATYWDEHTAYADGGVESCCDNELLPAHRLGSCDRLVCSGVGGRQATQVSPIHGHGPHAESGAARTLRTTPPADRRHDRPRGPTILLPQTSPFIERTNERATDSSYATSGRPPQLRRRHPGRKQLAVGPKSPLPSITSIDQRTRGASIPQWARGTSIDQWTRGLLGSGNQGQTAPTNKW